MAALKKKRKCVQCQQRMVLPPKRKCATCIRGNKKTAKLDRHDQYVVDTYGLLPGDYQRLLKAQGGRCAICGGGSTKALAVDHNHKLQGRASVRGLLCHNCNTQLLARIGKDDANRLRMILTNAIQYLSDPPAQKTLGNP